MKEQDIVRVCAELDGWYFGPSDSDTEYCWRSFRHYFNSYDAIIPLIEKVFPTPNQFQTFFNELKKIVSGSSHTRKCPDWFQEEAEFALFFATPAQLCEATLKAIGKWVE